MVATTSGRVRERTRAKYDNRVRRLTEIRVAYYVEHPEEIDERLRELEEEWDSDHLLDLGVAIAALGGLGLSLLRGSKWLLLSSAVLGFNVQRAAKTRTMPLALFRRLGIRTMDEIEEERLALRALRGDLEELRVPPDLRSGDAARFLLEGVHTMIEQAETETEQYGQDETDEEAAEDGSSGRSYGAEPPEPTDAEEVEEPVGAESGDEDGDRQEAEADLAKRAGEGT